MIFQNRLDAGKQLALRLEQYKGKPDTVILALPRGGVVTAYEIQKSLDLPMDIIVPRKISAPGNEEYAIGAITESGEGVMNEAVIKEADLSEQYIKDAVEEEKKEAERRLKEYRAGKEAINVEGKTVILIDDGIATGYTMKAAIVSAKAKKATKIVVAVPVIAKDTVKELEGMVDELVYLDAPLFFDAVGRFYREFEQTEDSEVIEIMKRV